MAAYKNGIETRKRLINAAYRRLLSRNADELKIRDIAQESGCSAPTVYQHFDSLEYLLTVASIRFLDEYSTEYSKMLDTNCPVTVAYLNAWRIFIEHVFKYPSICYRLYWDCEPDVLESAIQDYYGLFPLKAPENYTAQYYMVFFGGDIVERDAVLLRSAVGMGYINDDDKDYLSWTNSSIVGNVLYGCIGKDEKFCEERKDFCIGLVERTTETVFGKEAGGL